MSTVAANRRRCDWEVLEGPACLSAFVDDWDVLARRNPHATAFQSAAWYRAWVESVSAAEGQIPVVVRFSIDGTVTAAVALQRGEQDGKAVVTPLTSPWADYFDAVGDLGSVGPAASAVLRDLANSYGADVLLAEVIRDGQLDRFLDERFVRSVGSTISGIDLTDEDHVRRIENVKEYVVKLRRLNRIGEVRCEHFTDADAIAMRFEHLVQLHQRQWAGRAEAVAPFDDVVELGFREMVRQLAPAGLVTYTELRTGDEVVAAYLGLRWGRWFGAYRTAYDCAYRRYSPGHLMLRGMMRDFSANGTELLDLTRGAYAYKTAYANRTSHNLDIRWNSSPSNLGDGT